MKITQIATLRVREFPNLLYVLVHTGDGLVGLGETFYGSQAVEAWIHETAAHIILGQDPRRIEGINGSLTGYVGYGGTGVETRGRSAIDIALWDLLGQRTGEPLHTLLGGLTRDTVRIYNTCAGYGYVRRRPVQSVANWGLPADVEPAGPYEDLEAFLHRPVELAESLLGQGVTAMKIWPFDPYAEASGGRALSATDLDRALDPVRRIRQAVGDRIDIMVELHGLWNRPTALRILAALDEFSPAWYEDPIRADDVEGLAHIAGQTQVPLAIGETVAGLASFRRLCEQRAAGVVVVDAGWTGGITEVRKIAALAEAYGVPVAPHDCTGPVGLTVGTHLSASLPGALIQETVRAHYSSWYSELATGLPTIHDGHIRPPDGPGLGIALRPEVFTRPDAQLRTSAQT